MKAYFLLHPALFALHPVLFFYAHNQSELLPSVLALPLLASLGLAGMSALLLYLVFRDLDNSLIATSCLLFVFFSYNHLYDHLWASLIGDLRFQIGPLVIGPHKMLLGGIFVLAVLGGWALVRLKHKQFIHQGLTVCSAALLAFTLAGIVGYEVSSGRLWGGSPAQLTAQETARIRVGTAEIDRDNLPDIYYLVFDRYAAADTLRSQLGFDNSSLTNFLRSRGFFVASRSRANYPKTDLSLASSLNLRHLTHLTEQLGPDSTDMTYVRQMMQDHLVGRFLREKGYRYVHLGSWYPPTAKSPIADENLAWNYLGLDAFSVGLLDTTAAGPLLSQIITPPRPRIKHIKSNLYTLRTLKRVIRRATPEPKFVLAHILLPHYPYVFNAQGEVIAEELEQARTATVNYLDQLRFTNDNIKEIVKDMFLYSDTPPVIVLQADEGPQAMIPGLDSEERYKVDWRELTAKELSLKFGILNAYYLPGVDMTRLLYHDITPVNTFGIIFNAYLGTQFERLPDRSYIFQDYGHPYKFTDVTELIRGPGRPAPEQRLAGP